MTDTLYSCLIDVTNANTETTSHVCPTKGGPLSSHDDCDQVSQLSSPSTTSTISSPSSSMVEVALATYGKRPIETISHTPSLLDTKENKPNLSSIMATNGKSTELVFEATKLADSLQDYTHGTLQQHIHNIDSLKKLAMPEDCLGLDPGDYTKNLSASCAPKRRKLYTHSHQEQQEQNSTITNNTAEYVNSHTGCSSPIPPLKSAPSRSTSPCLPTSPTSIQTPSDAGDNDEPSLSFNSLKRIAESGLLPTHTPCSHCKSTDTPKWRKGPTGETTLCNACGLHYAKYLQGGPSTWKAPRKHHTKKKADHNIDPSKKTDSSSATIKARKLTKPCLKDRKKDVDSDGHDQKQLTSSSSPMVKTKKLAKDFGLRAKKVYLKAGMHSGGQGQQQLGNETLNLSRFSFPLPVHQGVFIMEKEKDFDLPLDIRQEYESGELFGWTDYSSSKKPPRYIRILHNSYVERKARKEDQNAMCVCVPQRNGYGCGEDCLNRMTFIECDSSTCPCGDQCSNQRFRKREFVKSLKVYLTDGRGWGLRTEEFIQQGTLITEYRGEIISDKTCQERRQTVYKHQKNFYFLDYHKGEVIDACSKGSEARFINHGCDPNCHIEKWSRGGEYHLGVFASKDIPAGSELFYDYNFSLFDTEALGQECRCGSTNCRGFLGKRPGQGRR